MARPISILTYHSLDTSGSVVSVRPEDFAGQMECLSRWGFRGLSLREAVDHRNTTGRWPDASVVLTFDDGYSNFYESALPVLRRHGFSATVFVITGHVGGLGDWATPPERLGIKAMLSWDELHEIAASGIEIGSHTRTHPDVRNSAAEDLANEIVASRSEIESRLGERVESFAYPFGGVNRESLEMVKREYRAACTTLLRRADRDPLHTLPRIDMYYIETQRDLKRLVHGELDGYLAARRLGRSVRRWLSSNRLNRKGLP